MSAPAQFLDAGDDEESDEDIEAVEQAAVATDALDALPDLPTGPPPPPAATVQKNRPINRHTFATVQQAVHRALWGTRLRRLLLVGTLFLSLLPLWWLAIAEPSPQSPNPNRLANLDFERGDLTAWQVHDGSCVTVIDDTAQAYEGSYYAQIDSGRDGCTSLSYDFHLNLAVGETIRFAVYAQSTAPQLQQIETVFWTGYHPLDKNGVDLSLKQAPTHWIQAGMWRCLEVTYTVANGEYDVMRAALHWPQNQETQFLVDGARMGVGKQSLCAEQPPQLLDGEFEQTTDQLTWFFNGEEACAWWLTEEGEARNGVHALQVDRKDSTCYSIAQNIPAKPSAGTTYRAAAWVHVEPGVWGSATWTLWARGEEPIYQNHFTRLAGAEWRCLEAELVIDGAAYDHLAVELHLETPGTIYTIDQVQIAADTQPLCPPQALLLNAGFETETTAVGWVQHANGECAPTIVQDSTAAQQGSQFVRVPKTGTCYSLFQDVYRTPQAGDVATFGIWARSPGGRPAHIRLQILALEVPMTARETDFFLTGEEWTCLQTQIELAESTYRYWRGEVHFHTDGVDYELDSAQFRLDGGPICPQSSYDLLEFDLLPGQQIVPGATISGKLALVNMGQERAPAIGATYWLADAPTGRPLRGDAMGALQIPALDPQTESPRHYFDLRLPLEVDPNQPYFLPIELSSGAGEFVPFLRLALTPCSEETLFCDIPNGYWAQPEVETAYALGITGGCRSDAQAYSNLPFCPNQLLWPEQMAVFFLRYHNGGEYRPVGRFQAHYADVVDGQQFANWIDEIYPLLGAFERVNCPQAEATPTFCTDQPMLRRDLLRAIGQILEIEPPSTLATHYVDLNNDPEVAALANHLWTAGILPAIDPNCPDLGFGPRFCGEEPARRVDAIVWMTRAFANNRAES